MNKDEKNSSEKVARGPKPGAQDEPGLHGKNKLNKTKGQLYINYLLVH